MKKKRKILAVDIDGILTIETKGHDYQKRTPNLAAIRFVNLLNKFFDIILFTSRYPQDRKVTEEWLKRYGVKYKSIVFGKLQYDFIIDDRAI